MDTLSHAFTALADPTRRAILDRLMEGEANFTALARPFEISKPAVVKHLKTLQSAGLIEKSGPRARPVYRLSPEAMKAPRDWLDRHQRFWEGSLDRLDSYVREITEAKGGRA